MLKPSKQHPMEKMVLRDVKLKSTLHRNTFLPPAVILLVQVQLHAFQLQIRAELGIRIDNQARSLPKNTSLTLSQLQPIREGTYVAKLQRAPGGYANVQDLPHDLPSFLSCKPWLV